MRGFNKITLIGNLGNEPEIRHTADGLATTTASLAVNTIRYEQDGRVQETTEWFRLVFFAKLAETACTYFSKGGALMVEGQLQTRPYEDRSGVVRTAIEVVVHDMRMLSGHTRNDPNLVKQPEVTGADEPFKIVPVKEHTRKLPRPARSTQPGYTVMQDEAKTPIVAPAARTTTRRR